MADFITEEYYDSKGYTYNITVKYGADAKIPEGASVTQDGTPVTTLPEQTDTKVSAVEGHPEQLKISLKSVETASINLKEGQTLKIEETENPAYAVTYTYKLTAEGEVQTGNTIASISDGIAMTVTNTSKRVDVHLNKVAKDEATKLLPGSEFKLYRKNSQGTYATDETIEWKKAEKTLTLTDGTLMLTGLPSGDYKLTETKAPAGYIIQTKDIYFTVNASGTGDVIVPTTGQEAFDSESIGASTTGTNKDTLVIPNTSGVELPQTGGIGTTVFYVVGGVLAVAALVLLVTKKRMDD